MSDTQGREIPNFAKMPAAELPLQYTYELFSPIRFGKSDNAEIHTCIDLREPTLDEIDEFQKNVRKHGELGALKHFIAKISEKPFPIIGNMGGRDMMVCQEYLMSFLKGSHPTGDTRPE